MESLQLPVSSPTQFFMDNQSAIKIIKTGTINKRTKHIDMHYHFICDHYEQDLINVEYIPTSEQIADILTKPLSSPKFSYFSDLMGLM